MPDYHINILFSDEDGTYIADIPDLDGCSAQGATPREALEAVLTARDQWLSSARAFGKEIPRPQYRPAIYRMAE